MLRLIVLMLASLQVFAGSMEIKSLPEDKAEVYVKNPKTGKLQRIGVTPIKVDLDSVIQNYSGGSKNFLLVLKKQDYSDYRVFVTNPRTGSISLVANMDLINKVENVRDYDYLISELFNVQGLIRSRNFGDAHIKLNNLEEKHPGISNIYKLKAHAYYLEKKINESLSFYRKAFSVNPQNKSAFTMKRYLEKELGVKK